MVEGARRRAKSGVRGVNGGREPLEERDAEEDQRDARKKGEGMERRGRRACTFAPMINRKSYCDCRGAATSGVPLTRLIPRVVRDDIHILDADPVGRAITHDARHPTECQPVASNSTR